MFVRGRRPNADYRKREHLTETEIEKLIEAARGNRYSHRDATMILVAYRHGLRASEICELPWDDIRLACAAMRVKRLKHVQATRTRLAATKCRRIAEAATGSGAEVGIRLRQRARHTVRAFRVAEV